MNFVVTQRVAKDLLYWKKNSLIIIYRIERLIEDIQKNPYAGLGKPELLKYDLQGCWSRRINKEHRLIYRIYDDTVEIISDRYHYSCA